MIIYLIVNRVTGKYYVGQHKGDEPEKYLQQKLASARRATSSGSYLFNSMRKHPDSSDWSIHALLSNVKTRAELDQHEKDFIKFLKSQDPEYGYNICEGGQGRGSESMRGNKYGVGKGHSEEWRRMMSALNKGNKYAVGHKKTEQWREAVSKAGQISGRRNVESGHLAKIRPLAGRVSGPKNIKFARAKLTKEKLAEGGRTQGRIARDSGQLARITTYEVRAAGGRAVIEALKRKNRASGLFARLNSPEHQAKALHGRWHAKRNVVNPECSFCKGRREAAA